MNTKEKQLRSDRKLTGKAAAQFQERVDRYRFKLTSVQRDIEHLLENNATRKDILARFITYEQLSKEFSDFLQATRTADSMEEDKANNFYMDALASKVHGYVKDQDNRSVHSGSSGISKISSRASELYVQKMLDHETAKVKLEFLKREQELLEKQAQTERELKLLQTQREYRQTEVELKTLEELVNCDDQENLNSIKQERTAEFVKNTTPAVKDKAYNFKYDHEPEDSMHVSENGLAKLMLCVTKNNLSFQGFQKFSDDPCKYELWKSKFLKLVDNFQLTLEEEIQFLCDMLGPESSKQAVGIHIANIHNVGMALKKIWSMLDLRYGAAELIVHSLQQRIDSLKKISAYDGKAMFDLSVLLNEIDSRKSDSRYAASLGEYDSSIGINKIVTKLPNFMQSKWIDKVINYKASNPVVYPPFHIFVEFIEKMALRANDPSVHFNSETSKTGYVKEGKHVGQTRKSNFVSSKKTEVITNISLCPIHGEEGKHKLINCYTFLHKTLGEKRELVQKLGLCFRCLEGKHLAKDCKAKIVCGNCGSKGHCSAFHIEKTGEFHGGENIGDHGATRVSFKNPEHVKEFVPRVTSTCTQICGPTFGGKSCAMIVLVSVHHKSFPKKNLECYALIDNQSNRSLAKSEFFDYFHENKETSYTLSSCTGQSVVSGRTASGYIIKSHDGLYSLQCPSLLECNNIPNVREEIPTPTIVQHYKHLHDLEKDIPEDTGAPIILLIGRDLVEAHHVLDQKIGKGNEPYAQKLKLGWTIIGETCLGKVHAVQNVNVMKTTVVGSSRESVLTHCDCKFHCNEIDEKDIFVRTPDDNEKGLSREDVDFFQLMDTQFVKSETGHWSAPLPFKQSKTSLPCNYAQAHDRAIQLSRNLKRNTTKQKHFLEFMNKIFENKHAEVAPPLEEGELSWYLPIFGIYHPKKPSKIRVVFDSSAKFKGVSLNDALMKGPDLTNSLVGVLLKFRKEKVAIVADVEQMFFNFEVHEKDRNFLRFLWCKNNDINECLIDYRMCVHVFGNSPSPAIATYGLRKSVCGHQSTSLCDDVCSYVKDHFYVDDGLISLSTADEAVKLLKKTQKRFMNGGKIRLHKIVSNDLSVMAQFPPDDLGKNITSMDFDKTQDSFQRSLGLYWNIVQDYFTYHIADTNKPVTKRGLLSVVGSVFDPLGFVAPVVLGGRLLLRQVIQDNIGWDEPISDQLCSEWQNWKKDMKGLSEVQIPRQMCKISMNNSVRRELHVFADASKEAIAAVAYMKLYDVNGQTDIGFLMGKSKVAPSHGHTIPRLELCASVLAAKMAKFINCQIGCEVHGTYFYTDSQVVLGYLFNETRRFFVYVSNRVDQILSLSVKSQWRFIPTDKNPADCGTRPVKALELQESLWLNASRVVNDSGSFNDGDFELLNPDNDEEIQPSVITCKTELVTRISSERFKRFSNWLPLLNAIGNLKKLACSYNKSQIDGRSRLDLRKDAEKFLIRIVQYEHFQKEYDCLQAGKPLKHDSSIITLTPFLDSDGLLRVGGRISRAKLQLEVKHPIIVPGKNHIAILITRHYHAHTYHQGRHLTEGAIRAAGYWITGGKKVINSTLHKCISCRKQRAKCENQVMSDLPLERLTPSPPFTFVGVDTFGPFTVALRKTRGGQANCKRWGVLFSCLGTRAVHIEVVEELSSSSFINALRRFISVRGPVQVFYSDRGTNFVGSVQDINAHVVNVENKELSKFLDQKSVVWKFNPPNASHMSGAWERMIGLVRRILENMLVTSQPPTKLTHEVLCTFMAEVCAILNSRPLAAVSNDPQNPTILSPSVLLTQKVKRDSADFGHLTLTDMYKNQWKQVQFLSEEFWRRWSREYLQQLQQRKKWKHPMRDLQLGDIVLLKQADCPRIYWPIGIITNVYPSNDGHIRKVSIRVARNGDVTTYTRPITQLIYLFSP